jgi:amino acid transporter
VSTPDILRFAVPVGFALGVFVQAADSLLAIGGARGLSVPPVQLLIGLIALCVAFARSDAMSPPTALRNRLAVRLRAVIVITLLCAATATLLSVVIPGYFDWLDTMHEASFRAAGLPDAQIPQLVQAHRASASLVALTSIVSGAVLSSAAALLTIAKRRR